MMEFGIKIYGYDPLLSKEEIENFGAKALSFSFSTNLFFQTLGKFYQKRFTEKKALPNKDFLLAQVFFCKKKKCIDVRGMFDEEAAKGKGFY